MSDVARKNQIIPTLNAVTGLREEIMRIDRIGQAVKKSFMYKPESGNSRFRN